MHWYFFDPVILDWAIKGHFIGGQFLSVKKEPKKNLCWWRAAGGDKPEKILRGQIKGCYAPISGRHIMLAFDWLCTPKEYFDDCWLKTQRWSETDLSLSGYLDVEFTSYYLQKDEGRIKLWGPSGEICHIFESGDHTNLIQQGNEFVPRYKAKRKMLELATLTALLKHSK